MKATNLFVVPAGTSAGEVFEALARGSGFRLQRIVSTGQITPPGEWYDQDDNEWVVLLSGAASLRFEAEGQLLEMRPGDYVNIPAHCRHRVEWTDAQCETIWLALHYDEG